MALARYQSELRHCLRLAEELLGGPARPIRLAWNVEQILLRHARLIARRGLAGDEPVVQFQAERPAHQLALGMELLRVQTPRGMLRVVHCFAPMATGDPDNCHEFWIVRRADYVSLYRFLRTEARQAQRAAPPIMRPQEQARLWDNTVGFLQRGKAALERYGVALKRGVLLLGEPGNGKTMACRWLRFECERRGLEWHSVTAEEYDRSRRDGEADQLFELGRPGIVFFDDLDMALRDRGSDEPSADRSTFLGAIDGLSARHGVIYVFTSNARLAQIDPAFRRPGRIDLVMTFERPDADLRREMITRAWHAEIVAAIDIEQVVMATAGLSFAEVAELKKLLVLGRLETGAWDWPLAWRQYTEGRGDLGRRNRIGFNLNGHAAH
jgi:cell division protease FtsH